MIIGQKIKLEDLKVKPGERVADAIRRLEEWARTFDVIKADPRVRLTVNYKRGTWVSVDMDAVPFIGAFPVRTEGERSVRVGPGYVNNLMPVVNDVALDGLDENGEDVEVPALELEGPGADLRSWVCVQTTVDTATGLIIEDPPKEGLKVVDVRELHETHFDGGSVDENGKGLLPLAQVIWRDEAIYRVRQIVYMNQQHRFVPPSRGQRGRHFFWSV